MLVYIAVATILTVLVILVALLVGDGLGMAIERGGKRAALAALVVFVAGMGVLIALLAAGVIG